MLTLKNILVGSAAVAGVATVAGNLTSLPDEEHRAAEQAYFADDPAAKSATYGGVLPGQAPLIRTHSSAPLTTASPEPNHSQSQVASHQSAPRPPRDLRQPAPPPPAYGGALSTLPLGEIAPNLSQLAAPSDPMNALIAPSFTGIPELDQVLQKGAVSVPQMVDALRQSGLRVSRMSPGSTTDYVLGCLSNFSSPGCAAIRSEVDQLHAEMTRIAGDVIP